MTFRDVTRPFRRIGRRIRKTFQSKYGKTKLFILAAGLVAVTAAGIFATGVMRQPGIDHYQAVNANSSTSSLPAGTDKPDNIAGDLAIQLQPVMTAQTQTTTESASAEGSGQKKEQPAAKTNSATQSTTDSSVTATQSTTSAVDIGDQPVPGSGDWLEQQIEKHKAEIDPVDLQDFRAIVAKLDQDYIRSLSAGGFTEDERTALREYLHSKLSDTEYTRSKQLFAKYDYLMDEE